MHWTGDWHMGGMWLWWLLIILAALAIIWLAAISTRRSNDSAPESPEQILKRRYAKGEIDRETYERSLADLRN